MRIGRILAVLFVVALVAAIGWRASVNIQKKKAEAARPAEVVVVPVEASAPAPFEIEETVHSTGSLTSESEVAIFSKVPGKIATNLVAMGAEVKPGQTVSIVNRDEVGYDYKPFEVKSDAKGIVARVLLNPGSAVSPAAPILALVDIDSVKVVAAVDEKKIRFIKPGMAAKVTLEAWPGETFAARVTTISPVANPVSRTVDVELRIPNPAHRLKPGMYAEILWTLTKRTAMGLPLVSVVDRAGAKYVFKVAGERAAMSPVTVGTIVGDRIEILSGLADGETVVTVGAGQLNDGDLVRVVARGASAAGAAAAAGAGTGTDAR